jgi:hypothetical protein
MITEALQNNLNARALRATHQGDIKTLRNLRSFAEERGDLPAATSTLSAMVGQALILRESGATIRTTYTEMDARLWFVEIIMLKTHSPLYAQVSLIALAAEEAGCAPPVGFTCEDLYKLCY